MRSTNLSRIFFILYCLEAGTLLLFIPWSLTWERTLFELPYPELRSFLLHPWLRGALSGFGAVHLVWGAHDLQDFVLRWRPRSRPRGEAEPS